MLVFQDMKAFTHWIIGLFLVSLCWGKTGEAETLSLSEAFERAREKGGSEVLRVQQLRVESAQEQFRQVRAQWWPEVEWNYRILRQDIPDLNGASGSSPFREPQQTTSRLSLRQPLFQGGGEVAAFRRARALRQVEEVQGAQVELDLLVGVAQDFFATLTAEKDLATLQALLGGLRQRERELQERTRIGRSRRADWLSAQAQKAMAEAELAEAEAQLKVARQRLAEWVVGTPDPLALEGVQLQDWPISVNIPPIEEVLADLEMRPDLRSQRLRTEVRQEELRLRKSARRPRLNAEANYYFIRPGVLRDSEWDGALTLTWPLFSGGVLSSQVREAAFALQQEELLEQKRRRQAQMEVQVAYAELQSKFERLKGFERAVNLSRQSFELQLSEYRGGLISYLEVHQAESAYYQARRAFERGRYQAQVKWLELNALVGKKAPGL